MPEAIRLNKYLSIHGYCSRREADRLIEQGRVFVNNKKATLGTKVSDSDDVRVEGRDRKKPKEKIYILINKPIGYTSSTDPRKKHTVMDLIELDERIYPVGHLDTKTYGLLMLTNDSVLSNRLTHPRYEPEKEYVVIVDKPLTMKDISIMQSGMDLEDYRTLPTKVRKLGADTFAIILKKDRDQQIEKMCAALDYQVLSLKRTRIGTLKIISSYPEGNWRYLTEKEVKDLKKLVGLETSQAPKKRKKFRNT